MQYDVIKGVLQGLKGFKDKLIKNGVYLQKLDSCKHLDRYDFAGVLSCPVF